MVTRKLETELHSTAGRGGRPPALSGYRIEPMRPSDLPSILEIERSTFPTPWTHENFVHEIERNPFACNRVVRSAGGEVEAYVNAWILDGEVKINNLAVRPARRGRGLGEALLTHLLELGKSLGCLGAMLEVRPTNLCALKLYHKLGFRTVGRRRRYYSDTGEDALVMRRDF
jgi:[ribosomal protein S18]-alanine N-acetyltransferase